MNERANTAPLCGICDVHPNPGKERRGRGGGSLRVFKQFSWLGVGSVKARYLVPPTSTPQGHNASCGLPQDL